MRDYIGNQPGQIPGRFVDPYYWWECGAAWGVCFLYLQRVLSLMAIKQAMIDYWYYTGDKTWNKDVTEGLLWQVGPAANYMPPNVSKSLVSRVR